MTFRPYNRDRDLDAALRTWGECGWIDPTNKTEREAVALDFDVMDVTVAEIDGAAECVVAADRGELQYLDGYLDWGLIAAVTTSRIARKQGLAGRLTARAVATLGAQGFPVAGLGMFEQGFYNKLGFGSGSYIHFIDVDPAKLRVSGPRPRAPKRLTIDDYEAIHDNHLRHMGGHGRVKLTTAIGWKAAMMSWDKGFGLGYYNDAGKLTHHIWCTGSGEEGPYKVQWMYYETMEQLRELLALVAAWGDQIWKVTLIEPRGIQIQDLIYKPLRERGMTEGSKSAHHRRFSAWWQMRMLDVAACLDATRLPTDTTLQFNLQLTDPIEELLANEHDIDWRGVGGSYIVEFGPKCSATSGTDADLPTLTTTVNAFTRLWLGVQPATGLALTDNLDGPPDLLDALNEIMRAVPTPNTEASF